MADMSSTIVIKSDQMNAEDLPPQLGSRTFTITGVDVRDTAEQPLWIYFAEFDQKKPFKPSLTVRKILLIAWGPETDDWIGHRLTLFTDPEVRWAGKATGGIRISHMSGITHRIDANLSSTRGVRKPHIIEPLPAGTDSPVVLEGIRAAITWWEGREVTVTQLEQWLGAPVDLWDARSLARLRSAGDKVHRGVSSVADVLSVSSSVLQVDDIPTGRVPE